MTKEKYNRVKFLENLDEGVFIISCTQSSGMMSKHARSTDYMFSPEFSPLRNMPPIDGMTIT